MIVARVNMCCAGWCGRGRTRHRTVITGNLWNVPPTQVGVQSLIVSEPVARPWAPQCDQFSFIRMSLPSAQASTIWWGWTRGFPTQLITTGTLAAGFSAAGWVAAAGAGAEAVISSADETSADPATAARARRKEAGFIGNSPWERAGCRRCGHPARKDAGGLSRVVTAAGRLPSTSGTHG